MIPRKELFGWLDSNRIRLVNSLADIIKIKALGPESGGQGELEKAEYIENLLGVNFERFDAKDDRVESGVRPNIISKVSGEAERTIWVVTHLDVVPEGDLKLWKTPPFEPVIKDGRVYGRGSEDNGQSVISSLFAYKAINGIHEKYPPTYGFGLAFVADEEVGSRYGIQYLLRKNVFDKDDLIVVPDAGDPNGKLIEIAEKSILWFKFTVEGKQSHASTPEDNASRTAMRFLVELDEKLHKEFPNINPLFGSRSTFEPTKREKNVDNVNTVPGLDISYMDCRVLPEYPTDDVISLVKEAAANKPVKIEIIQNEFSPPTPEDSEIVRLLSSSINIVKGVEPSVCGIGGNTCAAFFRKSGFNTAVWSTVDGVAHQPNEYAIIDNIVGDSKVFSVLPYIK